MSGWQPIDTAPKDRSRILAVDEFNNVEVVEWMFGDWTIVEEYGFSPTHWMPLPPPPEKPE